MDCTSTRISYKQTGLFSHLMVDYLDQVPPLRPFFEFENTWDGFDAALKSRQTFNTNREALVQHLNLQYEGLNPNEKVKANIQSLSLSTTFTVITAHQPNLLTGPLYFFYKIIHAIRLADDAEKRHPGFKFVPVYYMGNEDADLDELGHFIINGEKFNWETKQTGAVGHMKIDDALIRLITRVDGQIRVLPHGAELMDRLKRIFQKGKRIQQAMLELVNELFGEFGLVVMIADSALMKKQVIPVFEKELFEEGASPLVTQTTTALDAAGYKVQAHPRAINLFYLGDGIRNRIEKQGDEYQVVNTDIKFTADEIRTELHQHPERFSPNVILRGIYQESILPNVAFVGGGGETAYWLQLKSLFKAYNVFFPVLLARNSFLLLSKKQDTALQNMQLNASQLFLGAEKLMEWLVKRAAGDAVSITNKLEQASKLYDDLKVQATQIDKSLVSHIDALKTQSLTKLSQLEKKFLRAEKRKYSDQRRQLEGIFEALFPKGGLQERVENFMPFYGQFGADWLKNLYDKSGSFEQDFCIVTYK